ncbi:hypothetical protein [Mesorhizobium muleiense]|uniref:GMP synthase (glutamine-hydrolyzing) n=1 Tax=Mesorhizobium muleiense TaxID=1004279 RepID=UPI002E345949|nr:hypothetical protein [Mesorhizobium muleiense]
MVSMLFPRISHCRSLTCHCDWSKMRFSAADHGLMRKDEASGVVEMFRQHYNLPLMTADFYHYDMAFLGAATIINEVRGINRVVYDVTSKPPGTIEWE